MAMTDVAFDHTTGRFSALYATCQMPVVVFTNTGLKASVVWYALELLGYDSRLYSYENYWINQQTLNQEASLNSSE